MQNQTKSYSKGDDILRDEGLLYLSLFVVRVSALLTYERDMGGLLTLTSRDAENIALTDIEE